MWTFLSVLALCLTAAYGVWRWERLVRDGWSREPKPVPAADDPMPHDIQIMASAYSDRWARDEFIKRAEELRVRHRSWDEVRDVLRREVGAE